MLNGKVRPITSKPKRGQSDNIDGKGKKRKKKKKLKVETTNICHFSILNEIFF